jgi:hypothetical protein
MSTITRKRGRKAKPVAVPLEKEFHFYLDIDMPANRSASTLQEFREHLELVDSRSVAFHLKRGDFEKWVADALSDQALATIINSIASRNLSSDDARKELIKATKSR